MLVWNNEIAAVAAAHSVDPDRWWTAFGAVIDRIESRFARYEPLRHAAALMLGMLSGLERKNCWTIAEARGDLTPDGLQHPQTGDLTRVEPSTLLRDRGLYEAGGMLLFRRKKLSGS